MTKEEDFRDDKHNIEGSENTKEKNTKSNETLNKFDIL